MRNATKIIKIIERYDVNIHADDGFFKMVIIEKETNTRERFEAINFTLLLNQVFKFIKGNKR
jgi:hypothetical protein